MGETSVGEARKRALGAVGETCVIPGHDHTATVTAGAYTCEGTGNRTLAAARALIAYGRCGLARTSFSEVELARWGERLDWEAGVLGRGPLLVALPVSVGWPALDVAQGISELLGLRDPRWGDKPFVFAREFAMAWCELSTDAVKDGTRRLEERGVIERVGKTGRAILWELARWR
jgi:hypothetical protein